MKSFKDNVSAFWDWFQMNAQRIGEMLNDKSVNEVSKEISAELDKAFGWIAFLIGGKNNFELTLSPEGDKNRLYLLRFWKEQAPEIQDWTFFNLKPPNMNTNFSFKLNNSNIQINAEDFFVSFKINDERKKIDIEIYCEKLSTVDEQAKYTYAFLILDECLGEGYTETAIGAIDIINKNSQNMVPIKNIYEIVLKTYKDKGWQLFENPDEVYKGYQLKPRQKIEKLRDDVIFGYTSNINLIDDYLEGKKDSINYIHSVGAEYLFLVYNHQSIPNEQKVDYRSSIEEVLISFLNSNKLGYLLGGATGINNSYIDLIVFDVDKFNKAASIVLKSFNIKIECYPFSKLVG